MKELKSIIKEISEFGEMNDLQVDQYCEMILDTLEKEKRTEKILSAIRED